MDQNKALRLKIYFDNDTNVERVIDIDLTATLEDLHLTILAAFELTAGEIAAFWLCNENWQREQEIPMIRMMDEENDEESACMSDVEVVAAINMSRPNLIYEYDMLLMWVLKVEYIEQIDKIASMEYPVLVSEQGKAANPDQARGQLLLDNNPESIANDLLKESGDLDDYGSDDLDSEYDDY